MMLLAVVKILVVTLISMSIIESFSTPKVTLTPSIYTGWPLFLVIPPHLKSRMFRRNAQHSAPIHLAQQLATALLSLSGDWPRLYLLQQMKCPLEIQILTRA